MSNVASEFDFSSVDAAKEKSFLQPGYHKLNITEASIERPEGKNPYIKVTFQNSTGAKMTDKFFIQGKTPESTKSLMERMKYLHEAWSEQKLDKSFVNLEQVLAYFEKFLNHDKIKSITRTVLVGGEEVNGTVYTRLGWSGFVVHDNFKEEVFDPASVEYSRVVKKSTIPNSVQNSSSPIVDSSKDDSFNDLPF